MTKIFQKLSVVLSLIAFSIGALAQQKTDGRLQLPALKSNNKETVVIGGNLKFLAKPKNGLDSYKLIYRDLLTDKIIESIVKPDRLGNFTSTVSLRTLQQLQLIRMMKVGDRIVNGPIEFTFFAKPGNNIDLNYFVSADRTIRKGSYKGSLSILNNQYNSYVLKKNLSPFQTLIDYTILDSVTSEKYLEYQKYVEQQLTLGLAYNTQYIKNHKTDPYLKKLVDADFKYTAANMLLTGAIKAGISLDSLHRFFAVNDIRLNDSIAFSNYNYKIFIHNYYVKYLDDAMIGYKVYKSSFSDMGKYLLEVHTEFDEDTKMLARQMLDTIRPLTGDRKRIAMDELMLPYNEEYVASRRTRLLYNKIKEISNPALREIFMTKLLADAMDNYGATVIKQLMSDYDKDVRTGKFKDNFVRSYNSQQKLLVDSKLSYSQITNNTSDLITAIKNKHKGKVIFLDIWATWCKPCLETMSDSKKLREKLKGKNVVFVYLCTDSKSITQWKNFVSLHEIEGDNYFLTKPQAQALADQFYITTIPRYIIIDKNGNIQNNDSKGPADISAYKEISSFL